MIKDDALEPYTQLDQQALENILTQFDLLPLVAWRPLAGGSENSNYFLATAENQFTLTICENKTFAETEVLARLLSHLEKFEFETTRIILNKKGGRVSRYKDKPILLKSFLPGEVIPDLSDKLLAKIGLALGQLHKVPAPDYLPTSFSYGKQTFHQLKAANIDHPFVAWLENMGSYITAHVYPQLPKSLIHGDVFYNNVVVSPAGIPIIMDFEEACFYYRVFDLGMAIIGLCNVDGKIVLSKVHALLTGYQKEIQLTALEKENLKAFTIYAAAATAFWRFRQFNLLVKDERRKDGYLEMKGVADQVYGLANLDLI